MKDFNLPTDKANNWIKATATASVKTGSKEYFLSKKTSFVLLYCSFCNEVNGLLSSLVHDHVANEWRLFIISPKTNLNVHNENKLQSPVVFI